MVMGAPLRALALLATASFLSAADGPIPGEERQALIDLYNATGGENWTDHSGWLGPAGTECSWNGVACRQTRAGQWRVFHLGLSANRLIGTIPVSIAQLTHLENIFLGENQLSGSVPEALAGLKELKELLLMGNRLSGLLPDDLIRRWENGSLDIVADMAQFTDVSQIEFDWAAAVPHARQRITLRADGTAVLLNERFRDTTPDDRTTYCEKKEGYLDWSRFAKLARVIEKNGFYGLRPSYKGSFTPVVFETTRVTRNGKVYAVENYSDAGSLELWTIQRAIEGAAFGVDWEKTTTQPKCPPYVSPAPFQ
jgi:hypothetical protein